MKRTALRWVAVLAAGALIAALDDGWMLCVAQAADTAQIQLAEGHASMASPRFAGDGPESDAYGERQGYPVAAIFRPRFLVGMFSHFDQLWEARPIGRAVVASVLQRAATEPAVSYVYERRKRTLDEYLARNPVTGLLIARDNTILVERYQYGRTDTHRLASFSMAKTVLSMLIGIAIDEGAIRSINDLAEVYAPSLVGTEYGRTSIRHLLQMTSGVRFDEDRDVDRLWIATIGQGSAGGAEAIKPFNDRHRIGGAIFNYSSAETQALGLVLTGALQRPLASFLQERLWQPMGAEADASWMVDAAGQETGWTGLNAVLRDYARFGLLLAHGGRSRQRQIVPAAWVKAATSVAEEDPHLQLVWPEAGFGYGYQTWVFDDSRPMFALRGAFGQAIFIDPSTRLVMVQTAVQTRASDPILEALALWRGVVAALGESVHR